MRSKAALTRLAAAGGLLGGWSLTPKIAAEIEQVVKTVPTEASAIPLECFRGATGTKKIRGGSRTLKLTPLTALTFFMSPTKLFETLSRPAQAVRAKLLVGRSERRASYHRYSHRARFRARSFQRCGGPR